MERAIAMKIDEHNGYGQMKIMNCTDEQYVGRVWHINGYAPWDMPVVVRFDPQSEFCNVIELEDITI